eukprot:5519030-Lingulodinium_polyedra.AAC.1
MRPIGLLPLGHERFYLEAQPDPSQLCIEQPWPGAQAQTRQRYPIGSSMDGRPTGCQLQVCEEAKSVWICRHCVASVVQRFIWDGPREHARSEGSDTRRLQFHIWNSSGSVVDVCVQVAKAREKSLALPVYRVYEQDKPDVFA